MNKKAAENIAKALPAFFKNAVTYLKTNFEDHGKEILDGASGTAVVITKFFAQPLIDKYFERLTEKKLENFGFDVYMKSALLQAKDSSEEIQEHIEKSCSPESIFNIINSSLNKELEDFETSDVPMIFQPKHHPAVKFVKSSCREILLSLSTKTSVVDSFLKHFNENIEGRIEKEFGDAYEKHLKDSVTFQLKDNEIKFLLDMQEQGMISLRESENLKYEETFAQWKRVSDLREHVEERISDKDLKEQENALKPIVKLIDDYFSNKPDNHLEKILFIVADFGKGKSIFLKHYAAELAKEYLTIGEGLFPIYFNLRDFKNYSSEPRLGVISDYLETTYSIKIDNDYFKNKRYVFLIDSLDESGELNKIAIDKVIESIRSIQGIDKSIYKTNRIIVTSRPFDDGLDNHLKIHNPHIIKNNEGRDIPYFISIYGFKKEQFNDWIIQSLKTIEHFDKIQASGFTKKIQDAIRNGKKIDVYDGLVKNNTLSISELRRPIFAYMIYQLIINKIDFSTLGKIGVYLSFINLLTKDAKHIHDTNYQINLKEEFGFRNILHATAALWVHERQQGKQGALKKSDLCRVLEGEDKAESDEEILERFKNKGVIEIQFLSHSYFGESDNVLHFQHQSFAEILLAEYYLKVFIKYALDEEFNVEEARTKLLLGEPTEQTIQFLKEMLRLLKETAVDEVTNEVIEKRKLLFPLVSSLATRKHNRLFCNSIFYGWYQQCKFSENKTEIPRGSLDNWCINQQKIDKIIELSKAILEAKTTYLLTKADEKTSLYNKEVFTIQGNSLNNLTPDIDRWIALVVGNILFNELENEKFFNAKVRNFAHLFDLIKNWNYVFGSSAPSWGQGLFMGIDMSENEDIVDYSRRSFEAIDFSFTKFKNFRADASNWKYCLLSNNTFDCFDINSSLLFGARLANIRKIKGKFGIGLSQFVPNVILPVGMASSLYSDHFRYFNQGNTKCFISAFKEFHYNIFDVLEGLFEYGFKNELFTVDEIKSWFQFETEENKKDFFEKVDSIKIASDAG